MARPKPDNFKDITDVQVDHDLENLASFYDKLNHMMEWRLHHEKFTAIVDFLSNFNTGIITYISDEEENRQLLFCSQNYFTLNQLRDELRLFQERVQRKYDYWWADKALIAKEVIISNQIAEMKAGNRTKSTVGNVSKDDVQTYIYKHYQQDNEGWQQYIDKIKQSYRMMSNMADDIKHRSMILMSLKKEKNTFS